MQGDSYFPSLFPNSHIPHLCENGTTIKFYIGKGKNFANIYNSCLSVFLAYLEKQG
jgi:hypothetical protein